MLYQSSVSQANSSDVTVRVIFCMYLQGAGGLSGSRSPVRVILDCTPHSEIYVDAANGRGSLPQCQYFDLNSECDVWLYVLRSVCQHSSYRFPNPHLFILESDNTIILIMLFDTILILLFGVSYHVCFNQFKRCWSKQLCNTQRGIYLCGL